MQKAAKEKIVIVGCGNLAWQLVQKLSALGRYTISVYNHAPNPSLREFKARFKCEISESLKDISGDASYYFLCIPDSKVAPVARKLSIKNPRAIIMHCSGSLPLEELGDKGVFGTGVFYPVQTFTKGDGLDWNVVPIVVDSKDMQVLSRIRELASMFSKRTLYLKNEDRMLLHLCAVMVNNFPNALYVAASELLKRKKVKGLGFDLLMPLIRQTSSKLEHMDPLKAQTGPALRKDKKVIASHRKILRKDKSLLRTYRQMTRLIQKQQALRHA